MCDNDDDEDVQKRMNELKIEKEEALARTAAAEEKLRNLNEKIKQAEKQIKKSQKQKNIKNESDLTREDLSPAELMAILKKAPKKFKN